MSQTTGGFTFQCKKCYFIHILTEGNPHDGIRVPCARDEGIVKTYSASDFEPFYGTVSFDVMMNSVKEVK